MIKHTISNDRKKKSNHHFIFTNLKDYLNHSTPRELFFDLVVPLVLAIGIVIMLYFTLPSPRAFAKTLSEINSAVLTIIAILAGFNSASLAIIASSAKSLKSETIDTSTVQTVKESLFKKIKNLILNNPSYKELEGIVTFFAYAVISQLVILIICLLTNVILTAFLKIETQITAIDSNLKMLSICIFTIIWLSLVLHSIFLSIRNIDMIAHFIKYTGSKDNNKPE